MTNSAVRTAFVVGNVGKLGGELLNVLLESPLYSRVAVGVSRPMRVLVAKLQTVAVPEPLEAWDPAGAIGWIPDDVFLCLEPKRASYWKAMWPYVAIDAGQAVRLSRRLAAAGTRRAVLLTPLDAVQQLGAAHGLRDSDELALVNAGFEKLLILRPVAAEREQASVGFFGSIGAGVLRILGSYMTPASLQPLQVRRAAVTAAGALHSLDKGVHIIGAERLRELAGAPAAGKRLY